MNRYTEGMTVKKNSKEYVQGVPELLILRLLQVREMYGYEIVRGIRLRSNEAIQFAEGVIYPLLHSLQKRRLVAVRSEKVNGRPRIYYRLTKAGIRRLETKVSEWQRVANAVQAIIDGVESEPA